MLRHDFRTTLRSLARRRGYAALHVLGLAAGLAACLVVLLYAAHELTYDRFHPDAKQIYSAQQSITFGSRMHTMDGVPQAAFDQIGSGVAGVEAAVRADRARGALRVPGGDPVPISRLLRADPTFFDFFGFELQRGRPAQVLAEPSGIVLTRSTARALFGETDPVGRTVEFLERGFMDKEAPAPFTVSGVAADPPGNSTVRFDALTRFVPDPEASTNAFESTPTYLRLDARADTAAVLATLRAAATGEDANHQTSLNLLRLVDAHLAPAPSAFEGALSPLRYVYLFGTVALMLLVIAVINYVNLATAYAGQRRAEVGVRKTLGASRGELGRLFWLEALLLAASAGLIALALSAGAPWLFRSFFGFELAVTPLSHPIVALGLMGAALAAGTLAGAYPALYLARQKPVAALQSQRTRGGGLRLRQGLVVVQFALAVAMLSATWIVGDQLRLGRDLLIGSGSQTLVLDVGSESAGDVERLAGAIRTAPSVEEVVRSSAAPGASGFSMSMPLSAYLGEEAVEGEEEVMLQTIASDAGYIPFYNLTLASGRAPRPGETNVAVLTQAALSAFRMDDAQAALGRMIHLSGQPHQVIGVARDFYMRSVERAPGPVALVPFPTDAMEMGSIYDPRAVSVRVAPDQAARAVDAVQAAWREVFPDSPFAYKWLDDVFAQAYAAERRTQAVFGFAATLALVLACLGLFGLAAFAAMQRRKEIGVRKALGAGVARLVAMLSREFALLVLVGFAIAVPAAYVLMGRWLEGFAEQAPMRPGVFAAAGLLVLAVALATVGWHAWRAATVSPADVLRDE